jgi:phosphoglycolate phosphatase
MAQLVLWDVDGTLIDSQGIGAEVFDLAFRHAHGLALDARIRDRVRLGGKTDPQIALEYLEVLGIDNPRAHVAEVLALLEVETAAASDRLAAIGDSLPGVSDLLARLAAADGIHQTLLTGNLAANAAVKVTAFGLDQWLDLEIGAYGSDDADRCRLVPVALERARRLRGIDVEADETWVVGDTARDLACARAGGVRCLLVATGGPTLSQLAALEPDAVLEDLSDVEAVFKILTS